MMFKMEGFDKLQQELSEAASAIKEAEGTLGAVSFDPHDPSSIEIALAEVNRLVDEHLGSYSGDLIIGPLIGQLKETYRQGILEKAAAARVKGDEE